MLSPLHFKTLGNLLIQEANFLYGVGDKVEDVCTEFRRMQGFLKEADSKATSGDERVRNWVAEIREVAYDAEDIIETYALKVASERRREGIMNLLKRYACILNEGKEMYNCESESDAIKVKIRDLTSSLQAYGIKGVENGSSSSSYQRRLQLRRSYSHVVEHNVVRREKSIEELVMKIVNNEENHRILSIHGMGDLGKTTVAKKIYRHNNIRQCFNYFAWLCVSQECNGRQVWQEIFIGLTSRSDEEEKRIKEWSDDQPSKKLYQVLREKKCLVLLDDIWKPDDWDSLKHAFLCKDTNRNSKILLTTRNQQVASHADHSGFYHALSFLKEQESWELASKDISLPKR